MTLIASIAKWILALAGALLLSLVVQLASAFMNPVYQHLLAILLAGGYGGFVQGILRRPPATYTIVWPFSKIETQFGILGDVFVGIAASTAILFVLESFLEVNQVNFTNEPTYFKFIALGVICGYLGTTLLDQFRPIISRRLAAAEREATEREAEDLKAKADLQTLKAQMEGASRAAELQKLADAYLRWSKDNRELWDAAVELCENAIAIDPNNPNNYVHKSLIITERENKDGALYDAAIGLVDKALNIDPSSARAYYDRACYKHQKNRLLHIQQEDEVFQDLRTAIEKNDFLRRMAVYDPDLRDLRDKPEFEKLVGVVIGSASVAVPAPIHPAATGQGRRSWWRLWLL